MKFHFDKVCPECKRWAIEKGSSRERVAFGSGEKDCDTCHGKGFVLNKLGKMLLDFLDRWRPTSYGK